MGGSSQSSTQNTSQTLPAGQQRNVDTLLRGALDYYNSGGRTFYPGDAIANFDPLQTQGQNQLVNYAGGVGGDLVNQAIDSNRFFMDPTNIFQPNNIPGFTGAVGDLTRGYTQNLTEQILPSIRGGATASGQYGGSAAGIGQALAAERSNQGLSDSLSNLYLGAYGQGLDTFNQAQNIAPGLFALGAAPGQLTSGVGAQRQGQQQNEIQADVARHEFGQNEQMLLLNLLQQLTGSASQYGGTTTTNATQQSGGNAFNSILGGALGLASLWNPLAGIFGGIAGGAGGGGGTPGPTPGSFP